jgi:hypothetical protein
MPARIQPNRPYYPRLRFPYQSRGVQPRVGGGGGKGGAKGALGGAIDATPTGNVGGDIVKAIANTIQANRQNAAANQILNTQTPPRAGAVGPVVDPGTGQVTGGITPTIGTPPQTGGAGELQMRQQMSQQDLADQLQKAKIASELALAQKRTGQGGGGRGGGGGGGGAAGGGGGGNARRWKDYLGGGQGAGNVPGGTKAGKPTYEPYSIDAETDSRADAFPHIQADFDAKYGKGMYQKVVPNLGNATPDAKGNIVVNDAKGDPLVTLPPQEATYWQNRFNAGSVAVGHPTVGQLSGGINPNSGQPPGTQVNPVKVENNLQLRALPYDTWIQGPDGSVTQKKPLAQPQDQKTSQIDTGDQGQQVADTTQPDSGQAVASAMPQGPQGPAPPLAGLVPGSAPGSFDLGPPSPGGGLPQDTALADAIARARTQDQLSATA